MGPFLIQEGSDWQECNRLLLPGNAHISTAAFSSCLGTIWASANGAAWGLSEVDGLPPGDSRRSLPRLCFSSSEALRDKLSLSLSLDFLELVVWNRKEVIGMNVIDFFFCRRTLTVLYVSSWQSVGCQHTFSELEVYLVVIPLKSRQKQSADILVVTLFADDEGLTFLPDLWVLPLCHREYPTSRCHRLTMLQ